MAQPTDRHIQRYSRLPGRSPNKAGSIAWNSFSSTLNLITLCFFSNKLKSQSYMEVDWILMMASCCPATLKRLIFQYVWGVDATWDSIRFSHQDGYDSNDELRTRLKLSYWNFNQKKAPQIAGLFCFVFFLKITVQHKQVDWYHCNFGYYMKWLVYPSYFPFRADPV